MADQVAKARAQFYPAITDDESDEETWRKAEATRAAAMERRGLIGAFTSVSVEQFLEYRVKCREKARSKERVNAAASSSHESSEEVVRRGAVRSRTRNA